MVGRVLVIGLLASSVALLRCQSQTTELVVVIDTDLSSAEIDAIDVAVSTPEGFVEERHVTIAPSARGVLTFGVVARSNLESEVVIRASASQASVPRSRSVLRTNLVPSSSRLAQVSICRACGVECAERRTPGDALPAFRGTVPTSPDCGLVAVDAGPTPDAAIPGPPLLAAYDFEEATGSIVVDRSGQGRDGELSGDVSAIRTTGKNGQGRGVRFQRVTGEAFSCAKVEDAFRKSSTGALSFWFRDEDDAEAPLTGSAGYFDNQTTQRNHLFVYRFRDASPQSLSVVFQLESDGQANLLLTHPFTVVRNAWTRLAVSFNAQGARVLVGDAAPVAIPYANGQFWSPDGQRCIFGGGARATFDDVKIYARELSEDELQRIDR